MKLRGIIIGPPDTPYAGGKFTLEIVIPENYPFFPPKVCVLSLLTSLGQVFNQNLAPKH